MSTAWTGLPVSSEPFLIAVRSDSQIKNMQDLPEP